MQARHHDITDLPGSQESRMLQNADSRYIAVVVGTRPEIVKLAPVIRILSQAARFLHTGQHRDEELPAVVLAGARLPEPETLSGICGEPRHVQIGRMVEQLGGMFA
jgi:UDP-N-acetylglucosamine 2-epimerase (non-hydrolysing)